MKWMSIDAIVVTECHGERVRDVRGLRNLAQAKLLLDGKLHLPFRRAAIPREELLDFGRKVAGNTKPVLDGSQAENTTSMPHQDGGSGPFVVGVELFNGKCHDRMTLDHFDDTIMELFEPGFERSARLASDDPCLSEDRFGHLNLEDTVSGDSQARINAQDAWR